MIHQPAGHHGHDFIQEIVTCTRVMFLWRAISRETVARERVGLRKSGRIFMYLISFRSKKNYSRVIHPHLFNKQILELWYFATCHFIPVLLLFTDENSFSKKIPTDLSISERIEISYKQPSAAKRIPPITLPDSQWNYSTISSLRDTNRPRKFL